MKSDLVRRVERLECVAGEEVPPPISQFTLIEDASDAGQVFLVDGWSMTWGEQRTVIMREPGESDESLERRALKQGKAAMVGSHPMALPSFLPVGELIDHD